MNDIDIKQIRQELLGKSQSEIEGALGSPIIKTNWDSPAINPNLSEIEKEKMRDDILGDIWVYETFKISFNLNNIAKEIDDKNLHNYLGRQE